MARRDKDATWRSLSKLCRERDWSKSRLLYELENGLRYRTIPPGHAIDWHDLRVRHNLKVEASETTFYSARKWLTVGIEVLPPLSANAQAPSPALPRNVSEAEVPAPLANAQAASPAPPGNVSEADLRSGLQHLVKNHPSGTRPPDEETLHGMLETHLGASIQRDRIRQALKDVAPHFKLRRGRPRKSKQ